MADEQALRARPGGVVPISPEGPRVVPLSTEEAWGLLAGAPFGRIVFTEHALPAIRLVNHALVEGRILVRTHKGAALKTLTVPAGSTAGVVVVYEADEIDPETRSGWSVSVTGYARLLPLESDPGGDGAVPDIPDPWFDAETTHVVVIQPEIVEGVRLLGFS